MATATSAAEHVLQEIRKLANTREAQQDDLAATEAELYRKIIEGRKAGIPKLTLSSEAGVARATVYTILIRAGVE